jgi:hypothetical protein
MIVKKWTRGGMTAPELCVKKKTFSHRSRKSPNLYPTLTLWHRTIREIRLALDLCFDAGQIR